MELLGFRGFIFDADGVLFLGKTPIRGAGKALDFLRKKGREIAVVTNNATRTREGNAEHMNEMGIEVTADEVFPSSFGTAQYISGRFGRQRIFVVGESGLLTELKRAGHQITDDADKAQAVVVGLDRKLDYEKLSGALRAILRGATFIACNMDPTWPTENGVLPGTGSIVAALSAAAGKKPDVLIGKPNTYLLDLALRSLKLSKKNSVFIGDRLEMDIAVAHAAGMKSILVLSGVTDKKTVRGSRFKPDLILQSVAEIPMHW